MKIGDVIYIKERNQYGFIRSISSTGKIKSAQVINPETGSLEIIDVVNLIVEAVGLIKRLIFIIKAFFAKG